MPEETIGEMQQYVRDIDHACTLVGRLLWHFSKLEAAIDYGMIRFLSLEGDQGEIVAVNVDFVRKTKIVRSAISAEKDRADPIVLKKIDAMFSDVRKLNDYRIVVAHSQFEVLDGKVAFKRATADGQLKRQDPSWSLDDFEKFYLQMSQLSSALQDSMKNIKSYREHVDDKIKRNSTLKAMVFGEDAAWLPDLGLDIEPD